MFIKPELEAEAFRAIIEISVRSKITGHRMKQIVRPIRILRLVRLLALVTETRQETVQQAGGDFIGDDRFDGGEADINLAAPMGGGKDDGVRGDFWLEHGRHRL